MVSNRYFIRIWYPKALICKRFLDTFLSVDQPMRIWMGRDLTFLRSYRRINMAVSRLWFQLAQILLNADVENCLTIIHERPALTVQFKQTLSNLLIEYRSIKQTTIVRRWSLCRLTKYVFVSRILFQSVQQEIRSSKKIAVSIKNQAVKTPVCILFLMHTAIVSTRNAKPNMLPDSVSLVWCLRGLFATGCWPIQTMPWQSCL